MLKQCCFGGRRKLLHHPNPRWEKNLPKVVHLVIRCRAVAHDTCKSLNMSVCYRCKLQRNKSIPRRTGEPSSGCWICSPCFPSRLFAFTAEVGCSIRTREGVKKGKAQAFPFPISWQIELM